MKILLENGSINVYSFDKEYVIIGYHQDPEKEIRLDYIEKNNIGLLKVGFLVKRFMWMKRL